MFYRSGHFPSIHATTSNHLRPLTGLLFRTEPHVQKFVELRQIGRHRPVEPGSTLTQHGSGEWIPDRLAALSRDTCVNELPDFGQGQREGALLIGETLVER